MRNILSVLFVLLSFCLSAQITLTHNVGAVPIETNMFSCERDEGWSRVFKLSEFGISANEQFIIKSGQVALSKSSSGASLQFYVYSIDENFPDFFYSLYPRTLLGARGIGQAPIINGDPEIIQVDFEEPIIVPAGIDRILVTVKKYEDFYNPESAEVFIAGTANDPGVSWYEGCQENYSLTSTTDLTTPVPNANFFINVTGEVYDIQSFGSTTRLSHNLCDDIIETGIHSCTSSYIYWARSFSLEEFGISKNEEFVINSGQVGINKTGWLPEISFNIYKIDDNFPASFSETDLIGSSQYQQLSPNIDRTSQIIEVDFDTPIVIPANVERILVEVHKGIVYGDGVAFIAGSTQDNDVSWQRGCTNVAGGTNFDYNEYVSTADFGRPEANFYINVTGNVNHITNNFEMNISNICSEFLKEFSVENKANIASVIWDFDDPTSGLNNTSTDLSPFHDFSVDGTYTINATVTGKDGSVEVLTETIDVKEPPNAYGINNVYACEDNSNTGFSSSFNLSSVEQQVLGGQVNKVVTYIDGSGNNYDVLPNLFANTIKDIETIIVRVAHKDNPCCSSETTFDLIVNPIPDLTSASDLYVCNNDTDGFSVFDLEKVKSNIIDNSSNIDIEFYHQNNQQIQSPLNAVENLVINEEEITVRAINTDTNCYNETTFKLMVNPLPTANILTELVGCDDNNDGISEYFDTSNVETEVLGNQTGMEVSYFDANGNELPSSLPNPYTNSIINIETITVRVINPQTSCYEETSLVLNTNSQPQVNKPQVLYGCDLGNGFADFDTSNIEADLIGNQNGLRIIYFDANGNQLSSPLPVFFQNTEPWLQNIKVRVENELNSLCYSETSFDLIVNELPTVNIVETYFICNLEPSLSISVDNNLDTYNWEYQDGTNISNTFEANLINAGNYTLTIGENKNGIYCENYFDFELIRSVLPSITNVEYNELSDNNFIEIIASGDGDFEYSIDGINYQNSNFFSDVLGGVYTVSVKDRFGCGEDSRNVAIIDYPKYFTPNGDGINDFWKIKGIANYPNAVVFIYNRYGKLLKQINSNSNGWDGTFRGENMTSSDYWFTVKLDIDIEFTGHFSLKL
ncbi:gliding motility-associated C-terminal domain-containing protein [Flaviramulus basaltis]|uniref:Gliding motility-associated C-terminal domain-containing protein n=1 Tax=Flaviramulus basaltis TaxID=369401 RepID=A0A1K2IA93_9FLAO|nr:T9SS type B sorting domain-containing protein [Flaviramulus basaltis]SFZ89319.1 gliding motility-associated C-terminal domain-containing protein [Flaviramulus basaltis]